MPKQVDYDPFAQPSTGGAPVDYDPFAGTSLRMPDQTSGLERLGRGITDIASGLAQTAINAGYVPPAQVSPFSKASQQNYAAQASITPEALAATTNKMMAEQEAEYQARRGPNANRMDWMRVLGNIAGAAPLAIVPGAQGVGANVALGAGIGALSAGMQPVYEGDFWKEKARQAAFGAGGGAVGAGVLATIGRAFNPQVSKSVELLRERGVPMTPGQIMGPGAARFEQRAQDVVPFVAGARERSFDGLIKASYDEVLAPLGEKFKGALGYEGVASLQKRVSQAFEDALSKAKFFPDETFTAQYTNLKQLAQNMPPQERSVFNNLMANYLDDYLAKGNGSMDGRTLQTVEQKLRELASDYASGSATDKNILAPALREAHSIFDSTIERLNPEYLPKYNAAKAAYARLMRVQDATNMAGSVNGKFTPDALMSAVRSGGKAYEGKAALARGDAVMQELAMAGKSVLGNSVPDSGTPQRLLTQSALLGGGFAVDPTIAATIGAGSLLYTKPAQTALQYMMAGARPTWLRGASNALMRSSIPVATGAGLLAGAQ